MTYTKEFLISELQRFHRENGRVPRRIDMQPKFGYPSYQAYTTHFITFNNGLEAAKLKVNQIRYKLDGTETCYICGCFNAKGQSWSTKNLPKGQVICRSCYQNINSDYINGVLDKNSSIGKATISQRVVAITLGLELKNDCNCSINFGHPYDLYDKDKYNYINVKDSTLHEYLYKNPYWYFGLKQKENPDTYILVGFDEDRKHILRVWICNPIDKLVCKKKGASVSNTSSGLKKAELWEVDAKPYDDMLHKMSEKRKDTNGKNCILSNDDLLI